MIKPGKLGKVVARSLGDQSVDVTDAPQGPVHVAHTVTNGLETTRHCTRFQGCRHRTIAGGSGRKLVCRDAAGDPSCAAVPPSPPTCPGPADTDCGTCASGCVVETSTDCATAVQACIDIPPIAGGIGTICCSPCPSP